MKVAVFPGSFDPFTRGHHDIVLRSLPLFDKIYIAVGFNSEKKGMFDPDKRIAWIKQLYANESKIIVDKYEGLTVDYCLSRGAKYLIRGLRNTIDFEYEKTIAHMNNHLEKDIETIFLMTKTEFSAVSSSALRDLIKNKRDVSEFIPFEII